jgi:hypothetical protein
MQLENLAGEILVEPPCAVDAGDQFGAIDEVLVRYQHRRTALGGVQQRNEAPGGTGPIASRS